MIIVVQESQHFGSTVRHILRVEDGEKKYKMVETSRESEGGAEVITYTLEEIEQDANQPKFTPYTEVQTAEA